jgi:asparagine synthase (glutamine-hydrolysing)
MCGICGIFNYGRHKPVCEETVRTMTRTMVHRGPDEDGFAFDQDFGMGMRRLSIIDLRGGSQPIASESGDVVTVLNGEIYNYRALRKTLEGRRHAFSTHSDTESIVHAVEEWGVGAITRLEGIFGLAVWDRRQRTLLLARDPFGVKPLYFHDDGSSLVFGSEVRAVLASGRIVAQMEVSTLDEYLALRYVPAPRTAFRGVEKLRPGHLLVANAQGVTVRRFAHTAPSVNETDTPGTLAEQLSACFVGAVRRQLVADVPVGLLLSGGVDSSAVGIAMARFSENPIKTFTIGFKGDFRENELAMARRTAGLIGSEHHERVLDAEEYRHFLPRSIEILEEPIATSSTLALWRVCELASEHVKVVMSGQGADEPFGGYDRALGARYSEFYRALPAWAREKVVRKAVDSLPRAERLKRGVRSLGENDDLARLVRISSIVEQELRRELLGEDAHSGVGVAENVEYWRRDVEHLDGLAQLLYVDTRMSLPDNLLTLADKMSMATSLELRVPFLDLRFMHLAESIPSRMKVHRLTRKWILKRALADTVPAHTISRKKVGFADPTDRWFRHEWAPRMRALLLEPGSVCTTALNADVVRRVLTEHIEGRQDHKRLLFALLTLEVWHREWIDGVPAERVW